MKQYGEEFKQSAVDLSDEIGLISAAERLGVSKNTLSSWRQKRRSRAGRVHVGSGHTFIPPEKQHEHEMEKTIYELEKANKILMDALIFFAKRQEK